MRRARVFSKEVKGHHYEIPLGIPPRAAAQKIGATLRDTPQDGIRGTTCAPRLRDTTPTEIKGHHLGGGLKGFRDAYVF